MLKIMCQWYNESMTSKEYQKEWRKNNPEKVKKSLKKYREKNREICIARTVKANQSIRKRSREIVLNHYGGTPPKCMCCSEKEKLFLSIDHIDGGGRQHRKKVTNNTSGGLSGWLIKNEFPSGFQVLCMNCNWGKFMNNGQCPHKNICK